MKKIISILFFCLFLNTFSSLGKSDYKKLNLENKLEYNVYKKALKGLKRLKKKKIELFAIIDYTKPSNEPRFFLFDVKNKQLLNYTYVSHGKNSGRLYATNFSDSPNSFQSSLGFYEIVGSPYTGKFGYSIRMNGLEDSFNETAYDRAIVIHGADYVSDEFIRKAGFLGRTEGCPALPLEYHEAIINQLGAKKSAIFIYGDDKRYNSDSKFIN